MSNWKKSFQLSKNVTIFLGCFAVAFLFWVLKLLSSDYTTIIEYPIKYVNFPENRIALNHIPPSIAVKVNARGYDLIANSIGTQEDSIVIDAKHLIAMNVGGKDVSIIATKPLLHSVTKDIISAIDITDILLDTIRFYFDEKISKVVPVEPNYVVSYAKQHQQKGDITYYPRSVIVSGPKSILDTIKKIRTVAVVLDKIREDVTRSVPYNLEDVRIVVKPRKILVSVSVEKFTEATIEIPIIVKSNVASFTVKTFPEKVKLTYLVGLSEYDLITEKSFKAQVQLDFDNNLPQRLKVNIEKAPTYVKIRKTEPSSVEYIVKK